MPQVQRLHRKSKPKIARRNFRVDCQSRPAPEEIGIRVGLGFLWLLILLLVSINSFDALLGESDFRLTLVTDFQLFLGGDDF